MCLIIEDNQVRYPGHLTAINDKKLFRLSPARPFATV
ncbi:hypothetical protein ACVWZV_009254 [Bradyrhizobium sp. GM5.1]